MTEKVLVGTVPLLYAQSITMTEGYRVERILGSRFSQATQPSAKTIVIEAVLLGPERHATKKALEVMALTSRALLAAAAPALAVSGIPVVCGLTLSLDMQITDLRFTQSVQKRDAFDLSLTLQHVPRSSLTALLGEIADLAMSAGSAGVPSLPVPGPVPRSPL
ncbi:MULTISPECIES: hypothetical protein [unclassified Streptomyces]|uniref:hypothetical protein n=1 Tax=unclassified Streptomyces TaxID=2593676 RepID=UPI00093AD4E1|nr:hypothetical protein [Streptomyces sp. TSRI0281]OKI44813.1 hypothetical protein A6A29_34360 [Streptomyces sp. TSRI0281]